MYIPYWLFHIGYWLPIGIQKISYINYIALAIIPSWGCWLLIPSWETYPQNWTVARKTLPSARSKWQACIHEHIHEHKYICICISIYIYIYAYMHAYIYIYMHVYIYVYIYTQGIK